MGLLSRIFGIGKAEANAALDKLEDPVKITEQQIRDMKEKLGDVIKAQATSLANLNKLKSRQKEFLLVQEDYTKKAQGVKAKIESGATDDETGKKAIIAALNKADNAKKSAESLEIQIKSSLLLKQKTHLLLLKLEQSLQKLTEISTSSCLTLILMDTLQTFKEWLTKLMDLKLRLLLMSKSMTKTSQRMK
jgi:phage shock protein A